MSSATPVEDAIRTKVTAAFSPTTLEIYNDSHLHSHHKAMAGSTSKETHFRLVITSEAFKSKMQSARHRMVYALLREEMAREGGIHALQLKTLTPRRRSDKRPRRPLRPSLPKTRLEPPTTEYHNTDIPNYTLPRGHTTLRRKLRHERYDLSARKKT
ncbi:bolA domain-containing protein [Colletotrichum tofieldiae]|nr:bolA domain-containing protein [Colletotrichum tofieldiae]